VGVELGASHDQVLLGLLAARLGFAGSDPQRGLVHAHRIRDTTSHGDRPGERKARLVLQVLRDREADVLRFTHDLRVPPTNNQAERDLRPSKTQQKISGRLTSEARTEDRYRIRGYLSTAIKHGHNAMQALHDAILGRPWLPPSPVPA